METLLLYGARDSVLADTGLHDNALGQCDFVTVRVDVCASWECVWTLCKIAFMRFWIRMSSPRINLHLSMYITKTFASFSSGFSKRIREQRELQLGTTGLNSEKNKV